MDINQQRNFNHWQKKIESDIPFKNIKEDNGNIYLVSANNQLVIYLPQTQQLQFHEMPFQPPMLSILSVDWEKIA